MQITSTTLRRIIKEELDAVMSEDRAEHVAGIEAKIKRLEAEIDRAQERRDEIGYDPAADDPRTSKTYRELGVRIENMEDKLDTLRKQREELSAMEEGRASETPAERKERIAAEKEAKKKVDRARGSYYRHQPPDRPETYPGEFAARYMQEDAAMNEEDENVARARKAKHIGPAFDVEQNKFQLDPEYQEKAKVMRKRVAKLKGKMNEDEAISEERDLKSLWTREVVTNVIGIMRAFGLHSGRPSTFLERHLEAADNLKAMMEEHNLSEEDLRAMMAYAKTLYSHSR